MKKKFLKLSIACLCAGLMFTSCKKSTDSSTTTPASTPTQQTDASDNARVENESESAANDAENATSPSASSGRVAASAGSMTYPLLDPSDSSAHQGAMVDTSKFTSSYPKTLTITYDGKTIVNGRTRSGSITVALYGRWSTMGDSLVLTFNNYAVTRVLDNNTITFTGTKTIVNTSGGNLLSLIMAGPGASNTLVRDVHSSDMVITFNNGTTRTWHISRHRVIAFPTKGALTVTLTGTGTSGNYMNLGSWGLTREDSMFYSEITVPIVWQTGDCRVGPVSGSRTLVVGSTSISVTYGVNPQGVQETAAAGMCPYGVGVIWINPNNKKVLTGVMPY